MPPRMSKRSGEATVSTPSRSRLPWATTGSPDEKHKKPRLAESKVGEVGKAPMLAEQRPEEADAEEPQADDVEGEEADEVLTWDQRVETARLAWNPEGGSRPEDLGSPAFDPVVGGQTWCKAERLPFRLLAAALEESGNGLRGLRALSNLVRWVIRSSPDREGDLGALMEVLLDRKVSVKMLQRHIVDAMSASFGLKDVAVAAARALPPTELADTALAARQKQRTLFQPKLLTVAEVAAVIKENAALRSLHVKPSHSLSESLRKLLGRSIAEGRETWHLIRVLQNRYGPSSVCFRALAHAFVLEGAGVTLGQAALGESMAQAEDSILRAYAEVGGQTARLSAGLLTGANLGALATACSAQCGVRVLPMRAEAPSCIADAIERLGKGALLAEWQLDGDRVQVHARRAGAEVQVFSSDHGEWTERKDEVGAVLLGHLEGVADCVLDVMLMKPRAKKPKAEGPPGDESKASGTKDATGSAGTAEVPDDAEAQALEPFMTTTTVVVLDLLVLNGRSLTRMPLRQRRAALQKVLREDVCLKVVHSKEIASGDVNANSVKAELGKALGAYFISEPADKACAKCTGLMLKHLDGPRSEYFAGCRSPNWQVVANPHATGPEADAKLFACLNERERAQLVSGDAFHFSVVSARRTNTPEGVRDVLNVESQFKTMGVQPTWYVDEASLLGYQGLGLKAVVGGKLIPARNLALEDASSMGKVCVQVSDDISRWDYYSGETQQKTLQEANAAAKRAERYQVSPVAAARFILAKMRGVPEGEPRPQLGGVYPLGNLGHSFHSEEFSKKNFILGDFFVVDNSKCRFDTTMSLKEDYDFTCSHLKAHGAVLRCNRMVIQAKHETNAGGACTVRDAAGERERENIRILQRKWPGAIKPHHIRPNQVVLRWESLKQPEQ
mmetsp:Transcript_91350/g.221822  ORF Transcript_91350/g.221822 Transcript_91350/m.221822 type:complete len:902 (+) Transcript_91350:73-2778(+)